jgi:chemotaxis protein CheY-P-specific phosphatase CheC
LTDSFGHADQGSTKLVGDATRKKIGSGLTISFGHAKKVLTDLVGCKWDLEVSNATVING